MDADAKLKSKDIIEIQINKDVRHVYLTSLHEIEASIILRVNHLYNNNQALVPKFWGWLCILNRLARIGCMYYFSLFYSIKSQPFVVSNKKSTGRVCPVVDDG